tara:strand:- start:148 stop:261 length:114 start_codon:yes stop_codon:yes gene_type:complete
MLERIIISEKAVKTRKKDKENLLISSFCVLTSNFIIP